MQIYNAFHKFEGSHDAEDWVMMLKIQMSITEINYSLQYIQIEILYFKLQ